MTQFTKLKKAAERVEIYNCGSAHNRYAFFNCLLHLTFFRCLESYLELKAEETNLHVTRNRPRNNRKKLPIKSQRKTAINDSRAPTGHLKDYISYSSAVSAPKVPKNNQSQPALLLLAESAACGVGRSVQEVRQLCCDHAVCAWNMCTNRPRQAKPVLSTRKTFHAASVSRLSEAFSAYTV